MGIIVLKITYLWKFHEGTVGTFSYANVFTAYSSNAYVWYTFVQNCSMNFVQQMSLRSLAGKNFIHPARVISRSIKKMFVVLALHVVIGLHIILSFCTKFEGKYSTFLMNSNAIYNDSSIVCGRSGCHASRVGMGHHQPFWVLIHDLHRQ